MSTGAVVPDALAKQLEDLQKQIATERAEKELAQKRATDALKENEKMKPLVAAHNRKRQADVLSLLETITQYRKEKAAKTDDSVETEGEEAMGAESESAFFQAVDKMAEVVKKHHAEKPDEPLPNFSGIDATVAVAACAQMVKEMQKKKSMPATAAAQSEEVDGVLDVEQRMEQLEQQQDQDDEEMAEPTINLMGSYNRDIISEQEMRILHGFTQPARASAKKTAPPPPPAPKTKPAPPPPKTDHMLPPPTARPQHAWLAGNHSSEWDEYLAMYKLSEMTVSDRIPVTKKMMPVAASSVFGRAANRQQTVAEDIRAFNIGCVYAHPPESMCTRASLGYVSAQQREYQTAKARNAPSDGRAIDMRMTKDDEAESFLNYYNGIRNAAEADVGYIRVQPKILSVSAHATGSKVFFEQNPQFSPYLAPRGTNIGAMLVAQNILGELYDLVKYKAY